MASVTELRTNKDKDFIFDLDEIAREGARRMLAQSTGCICGPAT